MRSSTKTLHFNIATVTIIFVSSWFAANSAQPWSSTLLSFLNRADSFSPGKPPFLGNLHRFLHRSFGRHLGDGRIPHFTLLLHQGGHSTTTCHPVCLLLRGHCQQFLAFLPPILHTHQTFIPAPQPPTFLPCIIHLRYSTCCRHTCVTTCDGFIYSPITINNPSFVTGFATYSLLDKARSTVTKRVPTPQKLYPHGPFSLDHGFTRPDPNYDKPKTSKAIALPLEGTYHRTRTSLITVVPSPSPYISTNQELSHTSHSSHKFQFLLEMTKPNPT
jgi:hypothetical protein